MHSASLDGVRSDSIASAALGPTPEGSELPERLQFSSISEAEKIYRVLADIQLRKKPDFPAAAYFFQLCSWSCGSVAYPAAFNYREVRLCVDKFAV